MDKTTQTIIDKIAYQLSDIVFDDKDRKEISLDELFNDIGISVKYFIDSDLSGYLEWDPDLNNGIGGPVIYINATHSKSRRNFSLAHELGHLVLGFKWLPAPYGDKNELFDEKKVLNVTKYRGASNLTRKQKQEEQKANEFAAAFLMSAKQIDQILKEKNNDFEKTIDTMVSDLGVSAQAARIRLGNYLKDSMNE
ncbi:ImmA/IrrE family metallo-endopeptidase [Limosilactobacillus reuteri]|uniref:ImmA/IrrE family metallo-endopeptidase n=1 Tax=Limosilactobacillus reuteri TaxID=1598 RepID=A0AAW9ZH89_LIMRT|nr:ImmA/IrrE family metallo-endopeptidase [Limosilactobacillus reuteri]NME21710.1 ImmA/IrrE family metallo-endopeptidase [Limosilactobacillus reuteri]